MRQLFRSISRSPAQVLSSTSKLTAERAIERHSAKYELETT